MLNLLRPRSRFDPFRLNQKDRQRPTAFHFELAIGEAIYEFSFSVTQSDVVEEKLVKVQPASEDTIYHRKIGDPDPTLERNLVARYTIVSSMPFKELTEINFS